MVNASASLSLPATLEDRRGVTVSIIMPTYDVAAFVARAIDSVMQQTFAGWELIVVDDCSSDHTSDAVLQFARRDPRILLVSTSTNGGPGAARNIGLEMATGEWIAVLDGDDAWLPERLETLLRWAEETAADFVADNLLQYDLALDAIVGPAGKFRRPVQTIDLRSLFDNKANGRPLGYGLLKPLIKRSFLEAHSLRYRDDLRFGEDFRFYVDIFAAGARGVLVAEPYYIYTMPRGTVSGARSSASRTDRNVAITLSIMDDIVTTYAAQVAPDVRASMLACRKRVQEGFLLARFRATEPGASRIRKVGMLASQPQLALARLRQFLRTVRESAP